MRAHPVRLDAVTEVPSLGGSVRGSVGTSVGASLGRGFSFEVGGDAQGDFLLGEAGVEKVGGRWVGVREVGIVDVWALRARRGVGSLGRRVGGEWREEGAEGEGEKEGEEESKWWKKAAGKVGGCVCLGGAKVKKG